MGANKGAQGALDTQPKATRLGTGHFVVQQDERIAQRLCEG